MFSKCSLVLLVSFAFALADDTLLGQYRFLPTKTCSGCGPKLSSKCYTVICYMEANWFGANDHCNSLGMRLATIENQEQQDEVVRLIFASVCRNDSMWIGGTNLADDTNWYWAPTGDLITYNGWLVGKPDDPTEEHCLEQLINNCGWNDKSCDIVQPFICESVSDSQCPDDTDTPS